MDQDDDEENYCWENISYYFLVSSSNPPDLLNYYKFKSQGNQSFVTTFPELLFLNHKIWIIKIRAKEIKFKIRQRICVFFVFNITFNFKKAIFVLLS